MRRALPGAARRVREALVVGGQEAKPGPVGLAVWRERVGAEQHLVGVGDQQPAGRPWLAPQLGHAGAEVDVEVRVGGEHPVHPGQVLGRAADVGADEGRGRRPRHRGFERGQQPVERRLPGPAEPPVGMLEQLLEPLVVPVEGLEEGERVARVDEHRQAELPGRGEHLGQTRVVGQDAPALAVLYCQAEVLPDLEPAGSGRPGGLQASDEGPSRVRSA